MLAIIILYTSILYIIHASFLGHYVISNKLIAVIMHISICIVLL